MDSHNCHHPYHQNRSIVPSPRKVRLISSPTRQRPTGSTTSVKLMNNNNNNNNPNHHYTGIIPELRPFGTAVARQMYVITRLMQEGYLSFREHSILRCK